MSVPTATRVPQDFDPAAEKATIQILETLSRFENVSDLPREVVTNLLVNQALRQKLSFEGDIKKQVEMVKEALIEENQKVRSVLATTTEEARRLKLETAEKDGKITDLSHSLEDQNARIRQAETDLAQERLARRQVETRLEGLERRMGEDTKRQVTTAQIRKFLAIYLAFLLLALAMAGACLMRFKSPLGFLKSSSVVLSLIVLIWMWVTDLNGQTKPAVKEWKPYAKFHELRNWICGLVAFFAAWTFVDFVGRVSWDWFKAAWKR